MLKIGDFSKLSRVSIRMLRHYDDIGLLKPAEMRNIAGYLMNRRTRWQQSYTVHLDSRKPETWMGKN